MNYQEKTREELLSMLVNLEKEHESLKELYQMTQKPNDLQLKGKSKLTKEEIYGNPLLIDKLIESEEKLRNVFEHATVGQSVTTLDGRLQTNKAFCQILGYEDDELSRMKWTEITHPEDIQQNIEIVRSLLSNESNAARWEKRYIHKNGNVVWADINTSLHRNNNNEPLYFLTSIIDITNHKLAQEALKENASRLELAMKSANMASWEMNVPTGEVTFDQRKTEMLGYPPDNFKHYTDFMALVHPDDAERIMDSMRCHIHGTSDKYEVEYRILTRSGEYKWFYDIGSVVKKDSRGMPLLVTGLVIDISGRKKAEEEVIRAKVKAEESERLLNETGQIAKVGGWEINLKTKQLSWTKEVYRIHEVPDDYIPSVEKAIDFYDENSREIIKESINELISSGKPYDVDLIIHSARGNTLNVRSLGKIKYDGEGNPDIIYGTFQDVTAQKKAEQELLNAKEKAEENDKYIRLVADNLVNGMIYQAVILDGNQRRFTYLSDSVTKFYGCSVEEAKADANLIYGRVHKDDIERILREENAALEKMAVFKTEVRLFDLNGNIRWSSLVSSPRMHKGLLYWDGIEIDITDKKQAEIRLSESQALLNSIIDSTTDMIWLMDAEDFTLVHWNLTFQKYFTEMRGIEIRTGIGIEKMFPGDPAYVKIWTDLLNRALKEGSFSIEYNSYKGDMVTLMNFNLLTHEGKTTGISIFSKDITPQKHAEMKLQKANRLYNVISQVSQTIVHVKAKDQLLEEVCRIAVEYGNFRMSWIGLFDESDQLIRPVTFAGFEDGYLKLIKTISAKDIPEGRGPSGQAFRQGKYFVCNDFENDPNVALWKDEALKRNYHSSIGLPIKVFGKVIGVFTMYASVPDFFDDEEIELLSEVANDISYALEALDVELKHQQAVSALAVNEMKYRKITESIKDVVWVMNPETMHFTYVSPSVEKLRGYTVEEVMAEPVFQAVSPEFRESVLQMINRGISEAISGNVSSERNFTVEVKQPCKNGSYITTEVVAYFLLNEETGKGEIHGLTRDITGRKLAEESLRKSEERFHGIFNNLQDAFFQADLAGNISLVSPSSVKIFGYNSSDEMIGMPAANLYADGDNRIELIREITASGGVVDYITEGKKKDGTTFWASMNVQFRYEGGQISGTEGVVRDVTERKIQEDRINTLSSAVEQSSVMILITDTNGIIEYVNPKFCQVTGYTQEEVIGKNPRILNSGEKTQAEYKTLWDNILAGKSWDGEFCNVKKNGEIYFEASTISPITDERGLIKHFLAVKEDITEKRQLISDLIKAKERAEESDRLKSAFLANMSHEIRTPMNGIMGFIELLKEPSLTGSEQKAYIQVIEESGDRMLNLMNNLIDISRIESGEIKILVSAFDIIKRLNNIFNFFLPEANKKGLKLLLNNDLLTGESLIETDMQKLDAIIINLVKNAIKFTRQGTVEFGCTRQEDDFLFFVKDSGVGIDAGFKEIIFDRFRQASESLSRPYEGAGLGLSISKAFIESLGGKVWVESEVGKGSTFFFILPGKLKAAAGIPVPGTNGLIMSQIQQKELKVLIVEDDEISLNYLEIILGSFCKKFYKARTGLEAVNIFHGNPDINLILMDIKLPVMDGLEATRQIRQSDKNVVIIAQTAYSMVGDKEKALEAGCTDYISKPVNKDQLRQLILFHTKCGDK